MKCPKCKQEGCTYIKQKNVKYHKKMTRNQIISMHKKGSSGQKKEREGLRTDFNSYCKKCGFKGEVLC